MQQASLEPSADTFTTLLCGYARKGDIESIQSTLDSCDKREIFLLDKDYLDIVYALTTNGHGALASPILDRLRKSAGYNQDAINVILRLINKGHEDVALQLLKTMPRGVRPDGELLDTGNFFIKQMVRSGRPTENILKICRELESEGLNAKPLLVAIESGLNSGLIEMTLPLLKEAKAANLPIRQHYFWPLLCSDKAKSNDEILSVLNQMRTEFDLSPSSETIREYVIPNLKVKNSEEIIMLLRTAGVSFSTASTCTVFHVLVSNNLKEAADIATTHKAYYSPGLFRKPVMIALSRTQDVDSFVRLVRQIYDSLSRIEFIQSRKGGGDEETTLADVEMPVVAADDTSIELTQREVLGQIIHDSVLYFRKNRVEIMTKVLNGFVEEGLSISNGQAEKIQEAFGSELNADISMLLGKLASGDLEPKYFERTEAVQSRQSNPLNQMTYEQLETFIKQIESKEGGNAKGIKRFLLAAAIKKRDLEKTEEILRRLEGEGYLLTTGVNAQLIDLYVHHEKLDEAYAMLTNIRAKEPDFVLDMMKAVRLVSLLEKNDRHEDALRILDEHRRAPDDERIDENTFNYKTTCWRLLNSLAEAGKEKELDAIFESLIRNEYVEVNNILLGPLVKVHIVNEDIKKAIDRFEEICNKHKSTPWKNELACKLIQSEDAANLQRLTDLSTNIHGEVNSLYDLVFSFVECGRIRQARKILETPGLKNRPQRINNACERYHQEGMTQSLEGLMEATKDLNHIDRNNIFHNLLLSYCKEDAPEKALGLWTKMQEESIAPSEAFLIKLGDFLEAKGFEVPFVIPKPIIRPASANKESTIKTNQTERKQKIHADTAPAAIAVSEGISSIRNALKQGDLDTALIAKQNLKSTDKINIVDQSALIEALVKSDRLLDATQIVNEMLANRQHPTPRIFRFFLNKLAAAGEHQKLYDLSKLLTPEIKKIVSIDNRICHANIVAGNVHNYVDKLEAELVAAQTDQEVTDVGEKFPRGGAVGLLEKSPEIVGRFEEMAEKYAAKGIVGPMNVLWVHYFIAENDEACQRIWDKHLVAAPRLMFQRIVQLARDKQDERLIQRLIDLLKRTKVSEGAIGNAYSCLLDVYAVKEQYDDGLVALDSAVKEVCLENINRTALIRIKNGLEKNGKGFPHKIPDKTHKNNEESSDSSSSSSSSDDEKKGKKEGQK